MIVKIFRISLIAQVVFFSSITDGNQSSLPNSNNGTFSSYWVCAAWQQCDFKRSAITNHAYSIMLLGCNHNSSDVPSSITYIRDCSENTGTSQYGATYVKCGSDTMYNDLDLGIAGDSVTCKSGEEVTISSKMTKGQMIGSIQLIPAGTNDGADTVKFKGDMRLESSSYPSWQSDTPPSKEPYWVCAEWQQCDFKRPSIANHAYSVMLLGCNHNPNDKPSSITYIRDCSENTGTPQYGATYVKCGDDTAYNDLGIAGDSITCKPGEEVAISSKMTKGQMIGSIQLIPTGPNDSVNPIRSKGYMRLRSSSDSSWQNDTPHPKDPYWVCTAWQQCNFKKPAVASHAYSVMLLGCNHNPADKPSSITYIRDCSENTGTPQYGATHIKCGTDTTYHDLGIAGDSVTCESDEELVISSEITKGQMIGSIQLMPTEANFKGPCQANVPVDPKKLPWPHPGMPPWFAEPYTRVFNNSIVTDFVNSLKSEIVPGLPVTFEKVFNVFQNAGCLLYVSGDCIQDILLGLFPKNLDIEYSCDLNRLKSVCVENFGASQCYVKDNYLLIGKIDPSSVIEELEGGNWNSTIFSPTFTKEYTSNALSYDLNDNNIIVDISGSGVSDACSRLIRIPVPESSWEKWMTESVYHNNYKLPKFWELRATPNSFLPADNSTQLFIQSSVKRLWRNGTFPVESIFRKFYCDMVNGEVASDRSGCYVSKVPSIDSLNAMRAYNIAIQNDMGTKWYETSIVENNVNKIVLPHKSISSCKDLQNISQDLTGSYRIVNDIDCSDTKNWNSGSGFMPIGNSSASFAGTLDGSSDGDNYVIYGLYINNSGLSNVGLFGVTGVDSFITNVTLNDVKIFGKGIIGGLVGQNYGYVANSRVTGTITDVGSLGYDIVGMLVGDNRENGKVITSSSYGEVTLNGSCSNNKLGGLVGENYEGIISNSYSSANVFNNEEYGSGCTSSIGGFLGNNSRGGVIWDSYSVGDVISNSGYVGGFIGINNGVTLRSYAAGDATNKDADGGRTGGFAGYNYNDLSIGKAIISDCYAAGKVVGNKFVGGLVGMNWASEIKNSYSVGEVIGNSDTGGLVGSFNKGNIISSYYNKDTSGQSDVGKGEPKSTTEMMQQSTFVDWDFKSRWDINKGASYPKLKWQRKLTTISSCKELQDMSQNLQESYILINDIDCSDTKNWNEGKGFEPIGSNDKDSFKGTFDGKGFTINNLYINRPTADKVGLFGDINNKESYIVSVGITNADITGHNGVGVLVGWNVNGRVMNAFASGYVKGSGNAAGGLIGQNTSSIVSRVYSTVQVSGVDYVGGLVGSNYGDVSNSYAIGSVAGNSYIGGFIGSNWAKIENCYSTGQVNASSQGGGLAGYNGSSASITNSYWDIQTSGKTWSAGGEGKTTIQMKQQSTFSRWDFVDIWKIISGSSYPWLSWQDK